MTESSTALRTDRYELTMLDAATARRHGATAVHVRAVRPPPARRPPLRRRRRHRPPARADQRLPLRRRRAATGCATTRVVRCRRPSTGWPTTRFSGNDLGLPRGRGLLPRLPAPRRSRAPSPRRVDARDPHPQRAELRHARSPAPPPAWSRSACGRPLAEMGSRRTGEQSAVAAARAAYIAGFAATSNLEAGRTLGHPDDGHRRPRLHPAARQRGGRLPRPGRRVRRRAPPCWSTPTTSSAASRLAVQGRRHRARRRPHRLRRPADRRGRRCARSSTRSAP